MDYEKLFHDTHNAQNGEIFSISTRNAIRAVVQAAFDEAAQACMRTCGNWSFVRKNLDGSKDFTCPCADAVRKLKSPSPAAPNGEKK